MLCGYLQELWQEEYAVETIPFTRGADLLCAYKNVEHFDVIVLDTATEKFINQDILQQIYKYDTNVTIIILTTQEPVVESYKAVVFDRDKRFARKIGNRRKYLL